MSGARMLSSAENLVIQEELMANKWGEFRCSVCSKVATQKCISCPGEYYCAKCDRKEHSKKHRAREPTNVLSRVCDLCSKYKLELVCETCGKHMCTNCTTLACQSTGKPHKLYPMNGSRGLCSAMTFWSPRFINSIQRRVSKDLPMKVAKKEPRVPVSAPAPAPAPVAPPAPAAPTQATPPVAVPPPVAAPAPVAATVVKAEAFKFEAPPVAVDDVIMDSVEDVGMPHIGADTMKGVMLEKYNAANAQVMSLESEIKKLAEQVRLEVNKQSMSVALSFNTKRNQMQQALESVIAARDEALAYLVAFIPALYAQYMATHDPTKPEYKAVVATPTIVQRVVPGKHLKCAQLEAKIQALQTERLRVNAAINQVLESHDMSALDALGTQMADLDRDMIAQDTERCKEFVLLTVFSSILRDRIQQMRK
ncbi:hypothetical protein ACHHYP_01514 [Achlya hypogyna]|uniref:B box-type domain-containing protein n=1 Tax=Achlya hypogyna TaxID=1202772 RepID=A0A1V9ZTG1_ACHHY|nr:hypothetical protein ACHHYP_01514 [Achlya hypogyna]